MIFLSNKYIYICYSINLNRQKMQVNPEKKFRQIKSWKHLRVVNEKFIKIVWVQIESGILASFKIKFKPTLEQMIDLELSKYKQIHL